MKKINLIDDSKESLSDFDSVFSDFTEAPKQEPKIDHEKKPETNEEPKVFTVKNPEGKKFSIEANKIIQGSTILLLLNLAIPSAIALGHNKLNKRFKPINPRDIRLSKTQKNDLEPLADEFAKYINISMSPIALFIGGLLFQYFMLYMNMIEEDPDFKPKKKKKKSESTE